MGVIAALQTEYSLWTRAGPGSLRATGWDRQRLVWRAERPLVRAPGTHELEIHVAKGDAVPGRHDPPGHPLAIDADAVGATEIADLQPLGSVIEANVVTGDAAVVEQELVVRGPSDSCTVLRYQQGSPLVHGQGRPCHTQQEAPLVQLLLPGTRSPPALAGAVQATAPCPASPGAMLRLPRNGSSQV